MKYTDCIWVSLGGNDISSNDIHDLVRVLYMSPCIPVS